MQLNDNDQWLASPSPEWISGLKDLLQNELPGLNAHLKMAPPARQLNRNIPSDARLGGVMILLVEGDKTFNTLLIRRTEDGKTHGGQISFPGGRYELSDADIITTALRECEEEIGVDRRLVEVLGTLTPIYIPPSNYLVTPTIGFLRQNQNFVPSEREVQEIIKVPLSLLFDPAIKTERQIMPSGQQQLIQTPVYALRDDLVIWGATAMIISELEHLINNA